MENSQNINSKKPVCLHFHIFKNAGTTIDYSLEKNFGRDAIRMDTGDPKGRLNFKDVIKFLKTKCPTVKSFSSHQIRFPLLETKNFHFIPIVFIRHPIDRALSLYAYNKRQVVNKKDLMIKKAKSCTLKEYFEWIVATNVGRAVKDHQVFFLSGKPQGASVDLKDLEIAKNILVYCPIVGLVDRMDESLIVAEEVLQNYFKNINLAYVRLNSSRKRFGTLEKKLKEGKKELGLETYKKIEQENALDLKLYKHANEILNNRVAKITNIEDKLIDLKKRCEQVKPIEYKKRNPRIFLKKEFNKTI